MVPYDFNKYDGNRIVASRPGPGTAQTYYFTEDGTTWLYDACVQPVPRVDSTVPQRIGKMRGNRVYGPTTDGR